MRSNVIAFPLKQLKQHTKQELAEQIVVLRAELDAAKTENKVLHKEMSKKDELIKQQQLELDKLKQAQVNSSANQPSSKQPEFDKSTGAGAKDKKSKKGAKGKRKKRKKTHSGRKGAGNRSKPEPEVTHHNPLSCCPGCQSDLTKQPVVENASRIIEDIPPIPEKTIISEEVQERKWCPTCAKVVASVSEAALPKSDVGIRALCLMAYLWVVSAISLPGIAAFLNSFFRMRLSTSGISKMMIRLGNIMLPVYEEILEDVKGGTIIFADETGWRVKGVLWWLWIFANKRAAYYFPAQQRGSPVVEKILGTAFAGVLVTDAWCAYMKIVCFKQTCMAHIMRKIRKFRDAYPQYYSIMIFYRKLRRIILDGERLQANRNEIGEDAFARRLGLLHKRLDQLLAWKNPNHILKDVIAKVKRQRKHILTFVEHDGVPSHNNYGEYIIKKGVLKRKVSGGSMSEEGVKAYAILQSIAQTCLLRKISFLGFMSASVVCYIRTGSPMSLRQYELQIQETQNLKEAA